MCANARERVVVSVVSGRDPAIVRTFLRSFYASAPDDVTYDVTVTLNTSDAAREQITDDAAAAGWAENVDVRTNERPLGFAANHNRVMRERAADFYLICNDDIIVLPGAVASLLACMRDPANARTGVASPNMLNEDRSVQGSTFSFPSPLRVLASAADVRSSTVLRRAADTAAKAAKPGRSRLWAHDRTMTVDSVRGAFMLVRRRAISDAGLMDEIAVVGGEELEWHRRMAVHGWKVSFVHDAAVIHLGSQTIAGDPQLRIEYVKGWLNYFQKHGRKIDVILIRLGLVGIYGARSLAGLLSSDEASKRAARSGLRVALRWPRVWRIAVGDGLIDQAHPGEGAEPP